MIDTHTHIYGPEFACDLRETVMRASAAGVDKFVFPAIDMESFGRMMSAADILKGRACPCIGLHPTSVGPLWRTELDFVADHIGDGPWAAIGEIGLDGHWSREFMSEQITVFREQMIMASDLGWPVIIHVRDATDELYAVLDELRSAGRMPSGVFHAFSGSYQTYQRLKSYGDFLFGIGGVITYRNAQVARTAALMPLEDMVLETDAPYLTPVPFRGRRNEPAYLKYVSREIARIKGTDPETVGQVTTEAACRLFASLNG